MGPMMNLISRTHNYVRGRIYIYDSPRVSNNYPKIYLLSIKLNVGIPLLKPGAH